MNAMQTTAIMNDSHSSFENRKYLFSLSMKLRIFFSFLVSLVW